MRILVLALFFVSLLSAKILIASFNVQNLFDDKTDGTEYADFKKGGKKNWNKEKYEKKIAAVSKDIKEINADVILLLEIENERVLKELASRTGYEYSVFSKGNDKAPVGLGYLSKKQILSVKEYAVPRVKTRPILQIKVREAGRELNIFGAHFPAMKNSLEKRLNAAKTMLRAVYGVKNAIILGDLNSNWDDKFLLKELKNDYTSIWQYKKGWNSYKSGGTIDHIMIKNDLARAVSADFWVYKTKSSDHNALIVQF